MARKSRHSFLRLMQFMAVVLLLAACGGGQSGNQTANSGASASNAPQATTSAAGSTQAAPSPSGAQGTTSGQAVTLRYALWNQNQVPAMEQIVAAFKQSHPNSDVAIEVTPFDQYWTK